MEPLGAELEFETPKAESNKASRSRSVTVRFLPSINSLFDGPPRPVGNASPMRERRLRAELPLAGNVDAEAAVAAAAAAEAAAVASRFVLHSRSRVLALPSSFSAFSALSGRSRLALSLSVRSFRSLSGRSRSLSLSLSRSRSLEAESAAGASPRPVRGDDAAIARGADGGIIEVFNESAMDAEDEDGNNGDV